jgi:transposase
MPAACEVEEGGMAIGEMQGKIIEKVEEQALYIIQLNNKIKELEKKIEAIQLK